MKVLAGILLSGLLLSTAGCKPDAAVKRGAVVDQPTPKETNPVVDKPAPNQQPQPQPKVQ